MVVDDQTMLRQGLCSLLGERPGVEVVGDADDGLEALKLAVACKPDVVLIDMHLRSLNGAETTRQLLKAMPGRVRVLGFSSMVTASTIVKMLEAGATGFLSKAATVEELNTAIELVAAGRTYLGSSAAEAIITRYVFGEGERATHTAYDSLTPREREVFQLLAEGGATKQIADRLNVSVKTVDTHRYQIFKKLNLRGIADLTRYALKEGLTSLEPASPSPA
jgi:DNA-binding NarL/FixJ family response regulator